MTATQTLTIPADYYQVLFMDDWAGAELATEWTDEAMALMLLPTGETAISARTLSSDDVKIEIHLIAHAPLLDLSKYDHITEGSLSLPSGKLVVASVTGYLLDATRIDVTSGTHQFLYTVSGSGSGDETYRLYLWAGTRRPAKIVHSVIG